MLNSLITRRIKSETRGLSLRIMLCVILNLIYWNLFASWQSLAVQHGVMLVLDWYGIYCCGVQEFDFIRVFLVPLFMHCALRMY